MKNIVDDYKRDIAVDITKMHMNETYNKFSLGYYLRYAIDICEVVDRDIDFFTDVVNEKLDGSVLKDEKNFDHMNSELLTLTDGRRYSITEYELWLLRYKLETYKEMLNK